MKGNCRPPCLSSEDDSGDEFMGFSEHKYNQNKFFHQTINFNPEEELFDAVKTDNIKKVEELLAKGVGLNGLQGGWTPLMFACFNGLPKMLTLLLVKGGSLNVHKDFFTPLMAICSNSTSGSADRRTECVNILLSHGVDINATDRFRMTALMFAAREGLHDIVKLLTEKSCSINVQDKDGWSPLFHAVNYNRVEIIKLLVASGANIKLKDARSRTAYELAICKGLDDVASMIKTDTKADEIEPTLFAVTPVVTLEQMLNELPSKNNGKNPGFPSDVYNLLQGMNLQMYNECIYRHQVQLGEFLVIDDQRLQEIGIRFSSHRNLILESLKRFHMHQWQKSSIGIKPKYETLELLDGVKLMGNAVRQLYVLQSTIHFLLLNRPVITATGELKRIVKNALNAVNLIEKEIIVLHDYAKKLDHLKKVQPVDLITKKETNGLKLFGKIFKVSLVVAFGIVIWKQNPLIPLLRYKINT